MPEGQEDTQTHQASQDRFKDAWGAGIVTDPNQPVNQNRTVGTAKPQATVFGGTVHEVKAGIQAFGTGRIDVPKTSPRILTDEESRREALAKGKGGVVGHSAPQSNFLRRLFKH